MNLSADLGGELVRPYNVHPIYNSHMLQLHTWLRPYQEHHKIQQYARKIIIINNKKKKQTIAFLKK